MTTKRINIVAPNSMELIDKVVALAHQGGKLAEGTVPMLAKGSPRTISMDVPQDADVSKRPDLSKVYGAKVLVRSANKITFINKVIELAQKGAVRCHSSGVPDTSVVMVIPTKIDSDPQAQVVEGNFNIVGEPIKPEVNEDVVSNEEEVVDGEEVAEETNEEGATEAQETGAVEEEGSQEQPNAVVLDYIWTKEELKDKNKEDLRAILESRNLEVSRSKDDCRKTILNHQQEVLSSGAE